MVLCLRPIPFVLPKHPTLYLFLNLRICRCHSIFFCLERENMESTNFVHVQVALLAKGVHAEQILQNLRAHYKTNISYYKSISNVKKRERERERERFEIWHASQKL